MAEANRAYQLDPLSPIISFRIGAVHFLARRFDEAIAVLKRIVSENPTFPAAHLLLAKSYWGKGMYPQVVEEWKIFGRLSGSPDESDYGSAMEQGLRAAGWKGALTKNIEARRARRKTGYSSPYMIGMMYAGLGDKEQAFRWLGTAYQERDWPLISLKTDFEFDPLRSDPRFAELVRKVGLPQ